MKPVNLADHDEIDRYERALRAFAAGGMDADRFQSVRLQQGVYGQRQSGLHMLRVKVPGGRLNPRQLESIAEVAERFAKQQEVHITTRQDIQVHHIPLADTVAALRHLAGDGLTTREACGNAVRNVTSCPLAGVCPREHVDVRPFVEGIARHFLRHPLTQNLPRKFKIGLSGCEADCAQGLIHDVGVIAVRDEDGRFGFRVLAGGGLGHKPHEAILVEPFIREGDLLPVLEALISLHNRYSDRARRARSRLKFLVDRFGREGFVGKYIEELARTRVALGGHRGPVGEWTGGRRDDAPGSGVPRRLFRQKQHGLYVFPVGVPLGRLDAAKLRGIAALMERTGLSDIRTAQDQNLMLVNVPETQLAAVAAGLAELGLAVPRRGDNVVSCPGTTTCRLGITSSMVVAGKLDGGATDLRLRVSGCHSGCAQPETGDIGIYGEGKRLYGRLIPHYQMYFGGAGSDGGGLAFKGPSIPAARIETAVGRVKAAYAESDNLEEGFFEWSRRQGPAYFDRLLADLAEVSPAALEQVLRDHGDEAEFRVLHLGGGECGASSEVSVAPSFFEAANERRYRDAYLLQRKPEEALGCAEAIARLVAESLLFPAGTAGRDLPGLAAALREVLPGQPDLAEAFAALAERIDRLRKEPDEAALSGLFDDLDAWTVKAGRYCLLRDPQLDLTGMLPHPAAAEAPLVVPLLPNRGAAGGQGDASAGKGCTDAVARGSQGFPVGR
jgi:sulfite reductase beta subunit-like hemoprotein